MNHPIDRIAHTTAFVTPVVEHWLEQEIAWCNKVWYVGLLFCLWDGVYKRSLSAYGKE